MNYGETFGQNRLIREIGDVSAAIAKYTLSVYTLSVRNAQFTLLITTRRNSTKDYRASNARMPANINDGAQWYSIGGFCP